MPLTDKGEKILAEMEARYGTEKGKSVFYASRNKGTITGVDEEKPAGNPADLESVLHACTAYDQAHRCG